MNGQQQQPQGQQPPYGQPYQQPQPQYAVHQAPAQPFKLNKMLGYILIMVAIIFIPIGLIAINVADDVDGEEMGNTIIYIGTLLACVFTMLVMGMCQDLEKNERLGLLLFLGIVIASVTFKMSFSFGY